MRYRSGTLLPAMLAALVTAGALAAIVDTYRTFNQTYDEGVAVATGIQWLSEGVFTYEPKHPVLARVAAAVGPFFFDGARPHHRDSYWDEGNAQLYGHGHYLRTLTLARAGLLPFFLLAVAALWHWARFATRRESSLRSAWTAFVAVALFASMPTVLGHAGLATNDFALAATLVAALFALARWIDQPTIGAAMVAGLTAALAVLSKLSAFVLGPAGLAAVVATWWWFLPRPAEDGALRTLAPRLRTAPIAVAALCLGIWLAYGFSTATVHGLPVPVPNEIKLGLQQARTMTAELPYSYLLGRWSDHGFVAYFPVALAVKTPLPSLIFAAAGSWRAFARARDQRDWVAVAPLVAAVALLVAVLPVRLNLGIRYVLAIYPLLAVVAAQGAVWVWDAYRDLAHRALVLALGVWQLVSVARVHPDHLAYFNALAGANPDRVLIDSNLDWGQDLLRLVDTVRARHVDTLWLAYFGTAEPDKHDFPPIRRLAAYQHVRGWIAISQMLRHGALSPVEQLDAYRWLDAYEPAARVGRSILLYHLPP